MLSGTEDSLGCPDFCRSCSILALVKVNANPTDGSLLSSQCSDPPSNPPLLTPQHRPLGSRLRSKHHPVPHRALQTPGELVSPRPPDFRRPPLSHLLPSHSPLLSLTPQAGCPSGTLRFEGWQNATPNTPLSHKDYFELKAHGKEQMQEGPPELPFSS